MAVYSFTEAAPYEAGFTQIFQERIVPILKRHEETRRDYRKKALTGMGVAGTAGAGGAGAAWTYESEFGFVAGGAGLIGTFGVKAYFEGQWKASLGGEILPILCEFLGEMTYGDQRINLAQFKRLGVLPDFDLSTLTDPVNGSHDGIDWSMTEAILKARTRDSKGRTRTSTVFRGLLFKLAIQGPAPRIFFGKDRGGALNWLSESFSSSRRGLTKIQVGDAEFEAAYETYTSDADAAMAFIDDRLTTGLMEISRTETTKRHIACAMEGDWLYIALPRRGDFLGLGSLFRPLTTVEADLHEALADLTLPARVLDRLRGL